MLSTLGVILAYIMAAATIISVIVLFIALLIAYDVQVKGK